MSKRRKKISQKVGLPPGTLVYTGEHKQGEIQITIFDYNESTLDEKITSNISECLLLKDKPTVTWINIDGINNPVAFEQLAKGYGLHPLVMEDILSTDQRPKLENYGEYLYVVLKMLSFNSSTNEMIMEQVSIILGNNFVLSFQEGIEGDVFNPIRERIRNSKGLIRKEGADFLVYALLDVIVDNYFLILEKIDERIEVLEEEVTTNPSPRTLQEIYRLKRDMIFLRKNLWPLREVVNNLQREESSLMKKNTTIYLRDVYDHTIRVIETVETFRDILSGILEIYLSSVNNRMNSVIKILTIITTIFMPLSFIAGIYGMNFKYMPELEWHWGYYSVWLVFIAITGIMLYYFKKKDWL